MPYVEKYMGSEASRDDSPALDLSGCSDQTRLELSRMFAQANNRGLNLLFVGLWGTIYLSSYIAEEAPQWVVAVLMALGIGYSLFLAKWTIAPIGRIRNAIGFDKSQSTKAWEELNYSWRSLLTESIPVGVLGLISIGAWILLRR